eukprot:TRINITY_DN8327_c0_g1_i2.p2 TRINITY_DN8327_c0_g1~~TRINITY_DN8327_c0_g1_i2.p2  ORF type:complete len:164 (-),score=15.33 TRINITY_DN8327_c0_g1_i2:6-497(-)
MFVQIVLFLLVLKTKGMRLQGMEAGRGDKDRMGRLLLQQMEEERIRMSTQGCDPNDNTGICGPSKQNSYSNDRCDDFVPQGQEYNCSYYADLDLCGLLDEKYCQASCGRCAQVGSAFGEYIERPTLGEVNVRHSASTESVVYDTVSKGDLVCSYCKIVTSLSI